MLVVTSFVGIPMCYTFSCNILVTWDLDRILVIFTSCLACKYGVNHGNWLICLMMVQDCTSTCYVLFWIVAVSASGPKDLFMEHVTM
jgi:hypothetical protein